MSRPIALRSTVAAALILVAIAYAAVGPASAEQTGTPEVQVSFDGAITPRELPRRESAPVFLRLRGSVRSSGGSPPPRLGRIELAFGARGGLDTAGLPVCPRARLRNASARQALAACRGALVGRGEITTEVPLDPADPLIARAALLAFNGRTSCTPSHNSSLTGSNGPRHARTRSGGHAALIQDQPFPDSQSQIDSLWGLGNGPDTTTQGKPSQRPCHSRPATWVHAYSASPPVSFVLPFYLSRRSSGAYGVLMRSPVRRALGRWPRLRAFEITLGRRYRAGGELHSYLNGRCPLPPRFNALSVPIARATYHFAPRPTLTQPIRRRCKVRR